MTEVFAEAGKMVDAPKLPALQTLVSKSGHYLFCKDRDGRYTFVNDNICRLFGLAPEDILGRDDSHFFNGTSAAEMWAANRRAIESGKTVKCEVRGILKSTGEERIFWATKIPMRDAQGAIIGAWGLSTDITEQRKIEAVEKQNSQFLEAVLGNVDARVAVKDRDERYLYVNQGWADFFGFAADQVVGRTLDELFPQDVAVHIREMDERVFETGCRQAGEELTIDKNGQTRHSWVVKLPMNVDGWPEAVVAFATDITELHSLRERMERSQHVDELTGLFNRHNFQEQANLTLEAARLGGQQSAYLMVDVDRLKFVNNTLGRRAGDEILIETAARLKAAVGANGNVARISGDEFAIELPSPASPSEIAAIATAILQAIDVPYFILEQRIHISASIGIAVTPGDGQTVEELLRNAEAAMYHAKNQKHGSYAFFSPDIGIAVAARMELERELRQAVSAGDFELHYQPILRAGDKTVIATEALVRWKRPGHGLVPPSTFIPMAEELDLIEPIGVWVIEEACRQLAAWRDLGIVDVRMSINLSAKQLRTKSLSKSIMPLLDRYRIAPRMLELEITESLVLTDPEVQINQLRELRAMGFSIAVDDFGTGYSSLAYIQRLPVDVLKIDRSFVQNIEDDRSHSALCRGIIALAHGLDLRTVAEGVETEQQQRFLTNWGCDYLQGYLFSKPLAAEQATQFLAASAAGNA